MNINTLKGKLGVILFIFINIPKVIINRKKIRTLIGIIITTIYNYCVLNCEKEIIKRVSPIDIFPNLYEQSIVLKRAILKGGNTSYEELFLLCAFCKYIDAKEIFEIGTFDGTTTLNLGINTSEKTKIFTLDLPKAMMNQTKFTINESDMIYINKNHSGSKFKGTLVEKRITQLFGDSAAFNFSNFFGNMDFIFVDGSHEYEYVKNDSEIAFKLLGEKGIIAWHDYQIWDGVTKYLNELALKEQLYHVKNTCLVLFIRGINKKNE